MRGALRDTKGQVCGSDPRHHLSLLSHIHHAKYNNLTKTEKVGELVKNSDPTYPSINQLRLLPNPPRRARESQRASGRRESRCAKRARGDDLFRFMDGASKEPLHKVTNIHARLLFNLRLFPEIGCSR